MSTEGLTQRRVAEGDGAGPKPAYRKAAEIVRQPGVPSLLVAVSIPLVLGMIDGILNSPGPWYATLKKPWWNPPGFLFGLAWSVLYPIMGLASWLVWADGGFQKQGYPLTLYALQLLLNLAWPALFFGSHAILLALIDILLLVVLVAMTVSAFQPVNHVAANLMKPYLTWVVLPRRLTSASSSRIEASIETFNSLTICASVKSRSADELIICVTYIAGFKKVIT